MFAHKSWTQLRWCPTLQSEEGVLHFTTIRGEGRLRKGTNDHVSTDARSAPPGIRVSVSIEKRRFIASHFTSAYFIENLIGINCADQS